MKPISILFLLSLVLSHNAFAVPEEKSVIDTSQKSPEEFPNSEAFENLAISNPPKVKRKVKERPFIFLYESSLAILGGAIYLLDQEDTKTTAGLLYSDYNQDGNALEFSLSSYGSEGRFDFGKKYLNNTSGSFRLHYGWLVGLTLDADKGLANLVNFKKLLFGGQSGFEYVFSPPFSLRNDFKVFFGKDEVYLQLNAYLVFSW